MQGFIPTDRLEIPTPTSKDCNRYQTDGAEISDEWIESPLIECIVPSRSRNRSRSRLVGISRKKNSFITSLVLHQYLLKVTLKIGEKGKYQESH